MYLIIWLTVTIKVMTSEAVCLAKDYKKIFMESKLESFLEVCDKSDFSLKNIPFGVFSTKGTAKRPATRIG